MEEFKKLYISKINSLDDSIAIVNSAISSHNITLKSISVIITNIQNANIALKDSEENFNSQIVQIEEFKKLFALRLNSSEQDIVALDDVQETFRNSINNIISDIQKSSTAVSSLEEKYKANKNKFLKLKNNVRIVINDLVSIKENMTEMVPKTDLNKFYSKINDMDDQVEHLNEQVIKMEYNLSKK